MSYTQTRTTLESGKLYKTLNVLRAYLDKPNSKGKEKQKLSTIIEMDSILLAVSEKEPPVEILDPMGGGFCGFWVVYKEQKVWLPENEFCYLTKL